VSLCVIENLNSTPTVFSSHAMFCYVWLASQTSWLELQNESSWAWFLARYFNEPSRASSFDYRAITSRAGSISTPSRHQVALLPTRRAVAWLLWLLFASLPSPGMLMKLYNMRVELCPVTVQSGRVWGPMGIWYPVGDWYGKNVVPEVGFGYGDGDSSMFMDTGLGS
jgi:hypothetical protein